MPRHIETKTRPETAVVKEEADAFLAQLEQTLEEEDERHQPDRHRDRIRPGGS